MCRIVINRIKEGAFQTLGTGTLHKKNGGFFNFVTLELPNRHNKRNISNIPTGGYKCEVIKRPNRKKEHAILIKNVPGRSAILIHKGNFFTDIKGCVLVGTHFDYVNNDTVIDVLNSTITMKLLIEHCPPVGEEFEIEINKLDF